MEPKEEKRAKMTQGGRNLVLMGVLAISIAGLTTIIALAIYHNSGDIYLDRSRPGFLPDEEELKLEEIKEESFNFEKSGKITAEVLDEYLENLETEIKIIDSFESPFSEGVLSDEQLGIPAE